MTPCNARCIRRVTDTPQGCTASYNNWQRGGLFTALCDDDTKNKRTNNKVCECVFFILYSSSRALWVRSTPTYSYTGVDFRHLANVHNMHKMIYKVRVYTIYNNRDLSTLRWPWPTVPGHKIPLSVVIFKLHYSSIEPQMRASERGRGTLRPCSWVNILCEITILRTLTDWRL